jgi:hypothetical protein
MLGGWGKPMTQSQQVEANEASLRALYGRVFDAFQNIDASTLSSGQKDRLPLLRKSLEPAEKLAMIYPELVSSSREKASAVQPRSQAVSLSARLPRRPSRIQVTCWPLQSSP